MIKDRLTIKGTRETNSNVTISDLIKRLTEYEDTGLSPEDVVKVNNFVESQVGILMKELAKERKKHSWIPADEPPEDDGFVLLSFENFTIPMVGRYEQREDGSGNWYIGDCDEEDTCLANELFVNAWMPLPEPYNPNTCQNTECAFYCTKQDCVAKEECDGYQDEPLDPEWKRNFMNRFTKCEI